MAVLLLAGCQQGDVKLYCSGSGCEKTIDNPIDNDGNRNLLKSEIQLFALWLLWPVDRQASIRA